MSKQMKHQYSLFGEAVEQTNLVYVMGLASLDGLHKIGRTDRDPRKRRDQLGFSRVAFILPVASPDLCGLVEQTAHAICIQRQLWIPNGIFGSSREIFQISEEAAIDVVRTANSRVMSLIASDPSLLLEKNRARKILGLQGMYSADVYAQGNLFPSSTRTRTEVRS